ncbi:hypothetical protein JOB18_003333 [Solea senegalensis]|uniref:Uncharacterized protein n=1 Tax=Solea senegalensis TaxID=28829 RepID=A0AAV6QRF2_SOLSE|nr:hypothetical protein JOB18_003333 [Solea senegalensis]
MLKWACLRVLRFRRGLLDPPPALFGKVVSPLTARGTLCLAGGEEGVDRRRKWSRGREGGSPLPRRRRKRVREGTGSGGHAEDDAAVRAGMLWDTAWGGEEEAPRVRATGCGGGGVSDDDERWRAEWRNLALPDQPHCKPRVTNRRCGPTRISGSNGTRISNSVLG